METDGERGGGEIGVEGEPGGKENERARTRLPNVVKLNELGQFSDIYTRDKYVTLGCTSYRSESRIASCVYDA